MDALVTGKPLADVIDAYRTCELATLTRDGSPVAWPTSGLRRDDGTLLLTTSLGYPQKAFNIRRDGRVALLFSEPTASGLDLPEQVLVRGVATCPDEVHTAPVGDLGRLWALLMERQPHSQGYLNWPATKMADFYYMRLLIDVEPAEVVARPLPVAANTGLADSTLLGAEVLAGYPSVVLIALDAAGAPLLVRTTVSATPDGYRVEVPADVPVVAGPSGLLVHRHDDKLSGLHNANVRGRLVRDGDGWLLRPVKLVEPGARHRASLLDPIRIGRECQAATRRYLAHRNLDRPAVPWAAYRAIRAGLRKP
ncbi:pyridoxamine 5'-phosphate oxidase family protein [Actinoplanes awajinensis]|uniref:pyridoxamine 5'-phosphate oxidase family protein n=1 Tax=Actinoplanes awajinensis TaxID=135946 RepID=UPI000A95A2FF|nr:pyridoxamine 5'-phosphate oxidase family protein [Actinoplanes awajinensis]